MRLVEVENLSKTFGKVTPVDGISFHIEEGEFFGLVGPNGAGKTTTIHMILGLISPSAGEVRIFGKSFEKNREQILEQMNFTAPYVSYPARLTVRENLVIFANIYDVKRPASKISELLALFEIEHLTDKPVSRLSSGENTRVGLCKAFMNDPRLLLLDEPTAYLDPQVAMQVKQVLLHLQAKYGTTILYTSHNMVEVEQMCSRIVFLSRGKIIATGTPMEVTQQVLEENRTVPALEEVFLRLASRQVK